MGNDRTLEARVRALNIEALYRDCANPKLSWGHVDCILHSLELTDREGITALLNLTLRNEPIPTRILARLVTRVRL